MENLAVIEEEVIGGMGPSDLNKEVQEVENIRVDLEQDLIGYRNTEQIAVKEVVLEGEIQIHKEEENVDFAQEIVNELKQNISEPLFETEHPHQKVIEKIEQDVTEPIIEADQSQEGIEETEQYIIEPLVEAEHPQEIIKALKQDISECLMEADQSQEEIKQDPIEPLMEDESQENHFEIGQDMIEPLIETDHPQETNFEFANKYSTVKKEDNFMKKKLSSIKEEMITSLGDFNFKKSYSKLEREKIDLAARKQNAIEHEQDIPNENLNKLNINQMKNASNTSFMSDAKVFKSKVEILKEEASKSKQVKYLGTKRGVEETDDIVEHQMPLVSNFAVNAPSENINSLKKQKVTFQEDWTSLMSNSVKKKSHVQLEKEKFIEECKRQKEESLKSKNNLLKSQVIKFDDLEIPTNSANNTHTRINETYNTNNIQMSQPEMIKHTGESKICGLCTGPVEHNFKKLSVKCEHYAHQKCWIKLSLLQKSGCFVCVKNKKDEEEN